MAPRLNNCETWASKLSFFTFNNERRTTCSKFFTMRSLQLVRTFANLIYSSKQQKNFVWTLHKKKEIFTPALQVLLLVGSVISSYYNRVAQRIFRRTINLVSPFLGEQVCTHLIQSPNRLPQSTFRFWVRKFVMQWAVCTSHVHQIPCIWGEPLTKSLLDVIEKFRMLVTESVAYRRKQVIVRSNRLIVTDAIG